jgi:hypothetical protein
VQPARGRFEGGGEDDDGEEDDCEEDDCEDVIVAFVAFVERFVGVSLPSIRLLGHSHLIHADRDLLASNSRLCFLDGDTGVAFCCICGKTLPALLLSRFGEGTWVLGGKIGQVAHLFITLKANFPFHADIKHIYIHHSNHTNFVVKFEA